MRETLEDHLRRVTRNFTAPLPEDDALALGRGLLGELARAHAETPPRHPDLSLQAASLVDGTPVLEGGAAEGSTAEDLFRLGALLSSVATGRPADVSWRLDGPPDPPGTTVARRSFFRALAAPQRERRFATAAEALAALETAVSPPRGSAWAMFRRDVQRQGVAAGPALAALRPLWTAGVGATVASPALAAGMVLAATADGRLLWLDPASGRLLHELKLASAIESSPAATAEALFVGSDDGECIAVDLLAGAVRWRARLGQVVRSSPLPVGDRVVVGVVEAKGAGGLAALDAKGKPVWKAKMQAVFSSPALVDGRVVVGSDDGSLHAVDLDKGSIAWSVALSGKVRATPTVAADAVYAADFGGRLSARKASDGSSLWSAELGAPLYSSPCVGDELLVLGANDGVIHGVDRASGAIRFQVRSRGPVVASPLGRGGSFVVGSTDGDLYLLDGKGEVVGRSPLDPRGVASSAAVEGDRLYVGSARGVHALLLEPRP
ncbi:MAG TPA: PQQ-binding-like beta-propeller repeat protein [Vicinamibacteria bacterium]|nr:PQQ-binding-like beta-propeller repeat protein [Vicinamibacteria bacterium]